MISIDLLILISLLLLLSLVFKLTINETLIPFISIVNLEESLLIILILFIYLKLFLDKVIVAFISPILNTAYLCLDVSSFDIIGVLYNLFSNV